jgi:hypothetical protein
MKKVTTYSAFDAKPHLLILKALLISANALVLGLNLLIHIIFYDFPLVLADELAIAVNMMAWASLLAVGVSFVILVSDAAVHFYRNRNASKHVQQPGISRSLLPHNHVPAA